MPVHFIIAHYVYADQQRHSTCCGGRGRDYNRTWGTADEEKQFIKKWTLERRTKTNWSTVYYWFY